MKIKCILFDMDGVIIDSEPEEFNILIKTLALQGIEVKLEKLLCFVGKSSHTIASEIINMHDLKTTPEELLKNKRKVGNYYTDCKYMQPMEGLVDFLEIIKSNELKTAVVSSTSSKNVLAVLNRLALIKYFDAVICGDMVKETKPSPEGYLKAAEVLKVVPEECIVVEDSPVGIKAGKNAQMTVVGFKGSLYQQDTSDSSIEVHSFKEFRDLYISLISKKAKY